MGLTAKPSKNIDFSKIDDIQEEFFGERSDKDRTKNERAVENISSKNTAAKKQAAAQKAVNESEKTVGKNGNTKETAASIQKTTAKNERLSESSQSEDNSGQMTKAESKGMNSDNLKISDLLATAQIDRVRHTSRPFTVPRSLTIDLDRLKSKLRSRDLQYTQNELMDKMLRESLEQVTAENYSDLREQAFAFVKSPEQCSRRTVTLTEEAVSGMAELKAELAHAHNRRFSSDEIFMTLLAIAFSPLYENGSL